MYDKIKIERYDTLEILLQKQLFAWEGFLKHFLVMGSLKKELFSAEEAIRFYYRNVHNFNIKII